MNCGPGHAGLHDETAPRRFDKCSRFSPQTDVPRGCAPKLLVLELNLARTHARRCTRERWTASRIKGLLIGRLDQNRKVFGAGLVATGPAFRST